MRTTTNSFSFEFPENWRRFKDGVRLVAQGPQGEELILSSWLVKGPDGAGPAEGDRLVEGLFRNARRSAEKTAADPELKITQPFARDLDAGGVFPCWTLLSETVVQDIFFGEAVIRGRRAVMLVTFEAPYSTTRPQELAAFLRTFSSAEG